ncbi:hypothetical protein RHMOL_Rhmol06G0125200 [Rhododendron molle]|uniref:Uncharacterized protein n=1 Tax=Rhododendron molle TaxID=49168 RepID=A0ACC0NBR8_RHOML|nr:hypothetical protein RHMOL_Rhmol06G0125200 [Rhododendron molle]
MVEVENPHPSETTLGLGPLGDHNMAFGRAGALGKAHMSVGVGAGSPTQDAGAATELHTYIRHLERKIDNLSTVVESRGGRRSHHSPSRSREGGRLVEHQSRPSVKDRLEPPGAKGGRLEKGAGHRERSRSPNPKDPRKKQSAFKRLGAGSVSASSTHSVRIGKGHREPTPSLTKVANDEDGLLEFQTKGCRERLKNARAKSPFVSHPKEKGDGSQVTELLEPYAQDSYKKRWHERSPQKSGSAQPKRKE